jgi:rhodanese-related sulfurtransferase
MMATRMVLKELSFEHAETHVAAGAAYVDLRDVDDYLDVHIPRSIALQYEFGPGFPVRARDCIPLEVPFVLLDRPDVDMSFAAASLRGKGFAVLGVLRDGLARWASVHGNPVSTEAAAGATAPQGTLLDVGDPGAPRVDGAVRISIERLWVQTPAPSQTPVVIIAGRGVRASLAVGILERRGQDQLVFWKASARATPTPLPSPSR